MLCGLAAGSASATEASAKFSFNAACRRRAGDCATGWWSGPDFAETSTGIEVAAPFTFKAPRVDGLLRVAKFPAELGQAYIKIVYGSTDEQFMESIQFNPFALDTGPIEQRRHRLALISAKNTVWAQITDGQGERKIDALRGRKIGAFEAVELIGRYVDIKDSGNGTVLARVVALMRETSRDGLIATINIATRMVKVTNDAELDETLSADILGSVAFE